MRLPPGGGSSAGVGGVGDAVLVGRSALPCPPPVTRHAPPVTLHAPHRDRRSAADRHRLEAHSGPRLACWRQASDNHARKCLCHMGLRAHLSRRSGSPQDRRRAAMARHSCRIVNTQHALSHAAVSRSSTLQSRPSALLQRFRPLLPAPVAGELFDGLSPLLVSSSSPLVKGQPNPTWPSRLPPELPPRKAEGAGAPWPQPPALHTRR